jgi:hypothetical protein
MKTWRLVESVIAVALSVGSACGELARPNLSGRVEREGGGPVNDVTVFIYTAGPKVGAGIVCPSCYPDCSKKVKTSKGGNFVIPSLDPRLRFRLLVVAPDFEPRFVEKVDPADGEVKIVITPISEEKLKAPSMIMGMIMDEKGQPVAGATVGPEGVAIGQSTHWGGTDRYVDPIAVADEHGRFRLYCTNSVERVHAVVEGRSVAKRWIELKPGRDHLIRMQEGVTLSGFVRRDGRPVKDVLMGLATKDRVCGRFLRCEELATDQDGRFVVPNVPPKLEFVLYATMDSLPEGGVLPARIFTTEASGAKMDLGKFDVRAGNRVSGRVVLSDGKLVPPDTRIMLGREDAWDHREAILDSEGRFEFIGVPSESVGLSVRVKGYKLSKRNGSLDWYNGGMVGKVDGNITDMIILMDRGEWRYNGEEGDPPSGESQPRDKPLRGAKL